MRYAFAATESFNRRNQNASVEESLEAALRIVSRAREDGLRAEVTISVAWGCPFEGWVTEDGVLRLAERLAAAEPDAIVLADTIGVATPGRVRRLAVAALAAGATILDASVGGLGGCPFAPRATGNVATEDLVYLLEGDGVETVVDLDALVAVSAWLEGVLGRPLEGRLYRAGAFPPR